MMSLLLFIVQNTSNKVEVHKQQKCEIYDSYYDKENFLYNKKYTFNKLNFNIINACRNIILNDKKFVINENILYKYFNNKNTIDIYDFKNYIK